jgi:hypothetical protein
MGKFLWAVAFRYRHKLFFEKLSFPKLLDRPSAFMREGKKLGIRRSLLWKATPVCMKSLLVVLSERSSPKQSDIGGLYDISRPSGALHAACLACSPGLLLWGEGEPEPNVDAPVVRRVVAPGSGAAMPRDVEPTAAA